MTILITGAAGFIGSHTADALLQEGHTIIAVDNFCDYYPIRFKRENVSHNENNTNYFLYNIDITDLDALNKIFYSHSIDTIVHLAAQAGVRISIEKPLHAQKVNIEGTMNVFECARMHGISEIIYASSSSVYGNHEKIPFSENDPLEKPISPYAATKKANELLAYTYHHLYGMNMVGLRFFTVYGERGRPDMSPYIFANAIINQTPLRRFGDGSSRRDFTYIGDIVSGITACIGKKLGYEVINLGNSDSISLQEYIETFERVIGKKATINEEPMQPGDVKCTYADISKAKRLLDWQPTTSLEEGLRKFIPWFIENRANNPY